MADKLQVLVVTMNRHDHALLDNMNIQSEALIGNQSNEHKRDIFDYNGHRIQWYSWDERGVGLNRNNLLMRADADIILFADDDVVYDDGYERIVLNAFEEHPEADVILFNVIPMPESINPCLIKKWHRVRLLNCLKYGAVRIAARTSAMREYNVYFSLLFGGGARFSSGEDSLFMADCVRKHMKVYGYPARIGEVYFETSSWFNGYNEKYFMDKGIFFYFLSRKFSFLLCLQYCVRYHKKFKEYCSFSQMMKMMLKGIKAYKNEKKHR